MNISVVYLKIQDTQVYFKNVNSRILYTERQKKRYTSKLWYIFIIFQFIIIEYNDMARNIVESIEDDKTS